MKCSDRILKYVTGGKSMLERDTLIYLAVPYTHETDEVMNARFEAVTRVSSHLLQVGVANISPITLSREQSIMHTLPPEWIFWKDIDILLLKRSDELWVLTLDGWLESVGVQSEISAALALGKPVRYIEINDGGDIDEVYMPKVGGYGS